MWPCGKWEILNNYFINQLLHFPSHPFTEGTHNRVGRMSLSIRAPMCLPSAPCHLLHAHSQCSKHPSRINGTEKGLRLPIGCGRCSSLGDCECSRGATTQGPNVAEIRRATNIVPLTCWDPVLLFFIGTMASYMTCDSSCPSFAMGFASNRLCIRYLAIEECKSLSLVTRDPFAIGATNSASLSEACHPNPGGQRFAAEHYLCDPGAR